MKVFLWLTRVGLVKVFRLSFSDISKNTPIYVRGPVVAGRGTTRREQFVANNRIVRLAMIGTGRLRVRLVLVEVEIA